MGGVKIAIYILFLKGKSVLKSKTESEFISLKILVLIAINVYIKKERS